MSENESATVINEDVFKGESIDTEIQQVTADKEAQNPNLKNGTNSCETSTESVVVEDKPLTCSINIKFNDDLVAELYKSKFIKFITSFMEFRVQEEESTLNIYLDKDVAELSEGSPKKRRKRTRVKKELFVVDATPSSDAPPTDLELRYTTKFTINTEKIVDCSQSAKSGCFNCGALHSLKDCPVPKDYNKINEARQRFKTQFKSSRYHLDADQKYSHLEPGKISPELRRALGLHRNESPHFIYLMRQLGYPPGWLEEAKIVNSNLNMFDIDGNYVKGSVGAKKSGLQEEKIINYPGFNVPFEKGVKDDYRTYGVPPYSDNFSKKVMIDFYNKKFTQEEDMLEVCDMEVERDPEIDKILEIQRDSPSLVDLEQQKRQLLEALNADPKVDTKDSESDSDKGFLAVKTSCFGTPILKSRSPYSSLPNPDKFSKDVSPVINFENLPNSTGKYEQLTNVLEKVRTTLKNINSCNI